MPSYENIGLLKGKVGLEKENIISFAHPNSLTREQKMPNICDFPCTDVFLFFFNMQKISKGSNV